MSDLLEFLVYQGESEKVIIKFFAQSASEGERYLKHFFSAHSDCYAAFASRREPFEFLSFYYIDQRLFKMPDAVVLSRREAEALGRNGGKP